MNLPANKRKDLPRVGLAHKDSQTHTGLSAPRERETGACRPPAAQGQGRP